MNWTVESHRAIAGEAPRVSISREGQIMALLIGAALFSFGFGISWIIAGFCG